MEGTRGGDTWRGHVVRSGGRDRWRGEVEGRGGGGRWRGQVEEGGANGRWEVEDGGEELRGLIKGVKRVV